MSVSIMNYRVRPGQRLVDVDLKIRLPTGEVFATIVATEETLDASASLASRPTWDERDLVAVVSGVFAQLASAVSVVSA